MDQIKRYFAEPSKYYHIILKVEPEAKKRVRIYSRGGKVHGVNPSKEDEDVIRRLLVDIKERPISPISCACLLGMRFYRSLPKSTRKKDLPFVETEHFRPIKRPDLDNFIKLLKDAATGILWEDDNLIVGYLPGTGKYYTTEQPRIEVELLTVGSDLHERYIELLEKEIRRLRQINSNLMDFI